MSLILPIIGSAGSASDDNTIHGFLSPKILRTQILADQFFHSAGVQSTPQTVLPEGIQNDEFATPFPFAGTCSTSSLMASTISINTDGIPNVSWQVAVLTYDTATSYSQKSSMEKGNSEERQNIDPLNGP